MSKPLHQKLSTAYAEIKRIDELAVQERLRVNGLFATSETAVNAALVAQEKAVAAALAASEKAVNKAETAQAGVNATQNEFRGQLKDQAATQMPRSEAENVFRELRGLIAAQSEVIATLRSRLDVGPPSLNELQARSDHDQGRLSGWNDVRLLLTLAVAALAAYIAFVK